ncbi:MAG: protein translocase subunit SecDF [Bacteroidetes bacterium]|nr:MAG: protein translocase subunit SecDF [Bacteroidota bacterium]
MQSKSAVQVFAVALILVCIYQLSFTWITSGVEDDAREFANGDAALEAKYLDSISSEPVYNLLIKEYSYKECKDRELNLGLDLKGGMNVTLEVSVVDVIKSMANYSTDITFNGALKKALEMQKESDEDFVTLFGRAFQQIDPSGQLAAVFATRENQDKIKYNSTNEEVLALISIEATDAINRSFDILRARIDKFGVSQPNIQKLETTGRILVELPGVKEPERVRKLLQGTAKLEFWETYENREVYPYLEEANNKLKDLTNLTKKDDPLSALIDKDEESDNDSADSENAVDEEELVKADSPEEDDSSVEEEAKDDASSLLDQLGVEDKSTDSNKEVSLLEQLGGDSVGGDDSLSDGQSFTQFASENPLFALLRPAIFQDESGKYFPGDGPVVGYVAIKDTGKVDAYLKSDKLKSIFPRDIRFMWVNKPYDEDEKFVQLVAIRVTSREGRAPLEGDVIIDARQDYGQFSNQPEISMTMNSEGAKIWKRMTSENIGKSIAIVLDNYVYTFPNIIGEIPNGRSSITGAFTIKEAQDIANILKAGKLPAPARIVEEAIVGPSLGQEAIDAGLRSFLLALVAVLIYMIFYYSKAGIVANVALLINIFFIMGVLASLGAVLTLPGIAGIVLTIGMSIDANVLIFERIREEIRAGKGTGLAITDGYKNAYTSIIDANVTTLLVGIILFYFGTGPIKGFATTLIIGILTSLFSAIFLTRLIFIWFLENKKEISFSSKFTKNAFTNLTIPFMDKRKRYYVISGIVLLLGVASLFTKGLNLGVDFKGGRSYVVRFDENANTQEIRSALAVAFESSPEVKTFGPLNQVKITTKYRIDDTGQEVDEEVESKLGEGLSTLGDYEIMSSQKVEPSIADDIKRAAIWSTVFGLLIVFLYILMRFKKWQFGLGALAALFHDVIIVLSCFSIFYGILPFSLELDQAFIAALLTVIGYSINDTVVVFDRIREYMNLYKKRDTKEVMNMAINSTISRTFNTSISTFSVLLVIFILGGEVIRGFSFALLIGVVVGTYSSICIATPIALDTFKKLSKKS